MGAGYMTRAFMISGAKWPNSLHKERRRSCGSGWSSASQLGLVADRCLIS